MGGALTDRSTASVLGIVLLVGVAVVLGAATVTLSTTLLPEKQSTTSFTAAFDIDRTDGNLTLGPSYVPAETRFHLEINGKRAYTWQDASTRRLSCLTRGDEIQVIAESTTSDESYLVVDREIDVPTACRLSGTASQFVYAKLGDRKFPLREENYKFTLAIDPDGPNDEKGDNDYPTSNGWIYIQEYDKQIEGLGPPAYVVVFPDNVHQTDGYQWNVAPPESERREMTNSYTLVENTTGPGDNVKVTAGGIEPTDDVYLVFAPGCSESKLKFVRMQGGFNNQILLDGNELFRTDSANRGDVYTVPGVECT